jgi:hypothetical protein
MKLVPISSAAGQSRLRGRQPRIQNLGMKIRISGVLAAVALATGAGPATGQVFTPSFMSPQQGSDLGVYLNDGPGSFSIEGIWRRTLGSYDLGFRAGIADTPDLSLLVGAELLVPLDVQDLPLAIAATGGVQGALGGASAAGFIGGVTLGYTFQESQFAFTPYIHPRIGLVNSFRRDDLELEVLADIGFDVTFAQNLILRFGFGLGDPTASWGMGFAWR